MFIFELDIGLGWLIFFILVIVGKVCIKCM